MKKQHATMIHRGAFSGHLRRAQSRFKQAIITEGTSDAFVQSALGACAAAVGLRVLRAPGIGSLMTRWAPILVFMGLYARLVPSSRRS
jgi:hypothetical protein